MNWRYLYNGNVISKSSLIRILRDNCEISQRELSDDAMLKHAYSLGEFEKII